MANKPGTPISAAVMDNLAGPQIYADGAAAFFLHAGNITVAISSFRALVGPDTSPVTAVVVGRLTMPIAGAQALAIGLYDFLKQNGFDPAAAPPGTLQQ